MDCGDNSCLFAETKGGMRTNGGCRCLRDLPHALQRDIHRRVLSLAQQLASKLAKMASLADHWAKHGTEGPQCVDELRNLADARLYDDRTK